MSGGSWHITMPNFLKTGPSIAEILWFLDFPNGCRRHLGFFNLQNFIGCRSWEGWHTSPFQILSKLVNLSWRYCNIFIFLRWRLSPTLIVEIVKFYWLTGSRGSRRISIRNIVKICQSLSKIFRFLNFHRATAMLSAVYAVVVSLRLCVCVCVCHTPVLYQNG